MAPWARAVLVGAGVACLGVGFAVTPAYTAFETRVGLNALFHLRGPRPAPPEVVVVAIDGRTGGRLGLPDLPRDWPRSTHARLVDALTARGAKAIVFDMDFRRARNDEDDRELGKAIARSGRVVLFEHLNGRMQPIEDAQGRQQGMVWIEAMEPPIAAIAGGARGLAPFPLPKLEAAVDQFWTFKSSAQDAPTMPCVAFQIYAEDSYPGLAAALKLSGLPGAAALPARLADAGDAEGLRDVMVGMRRMFESAPALAHTVAAGAATPQLAALAAFYSGTNQRHLNYYGPPGAITTLPYHAFIKGGGPNLPDAALDLHGKVAFVGYSDLYDPGQPDRFYTVFTREDGVDLSGVEIAATAFANLARIETLVAPGPGGTMAVIAACGLVLGFLAYLAPAAWGVPLVVALALGYGTAASLVFNASAHWWPVATPLLVQFPLALFLGLMGQYWHQRRKVRTISDAIRNYVPEDVYHNLVGDAPDEATVDRVTYGTCLATDMAGFSTIAERMKPALLAKLLNDYFEALAGALKRHGVSVTEFRADAIMCAWTGQRDDSAVHLKPVLAALEASQAIEVFNTARGIKGSLRIGLANGDFYVGHAGGGGHFVYSIVGDCANTASRIESLNKQLGTSILATRGVVENCTEFLLRELGNFRFVGKTEALPIVEIMAFASAATDAQRKLAAGFEEALALYSAGKFERAQSAFESLGTRFPSDGPAQFMAARCRDHVAGSLPPAEPGVIALTSK
ncbi:MAG: adenylate/guanylate cyclase domain-containing protein [Rhodocyclaceae bacterium]|nr:adenylate/guanylate cyclase domain-containing protein [Rhodocyclaceae bacterium]MBX3668789.1 adenylate/guanylate cyclase domain-containing protein [Rhodocyclaceae bacterium]